MNVNVKIDGDELLEMLINRIKFWTKDDDVVELYRKMYENYIEGGCFDGIELDVDAIVDNDYVNYCNVVYEGEDDYSDLLEVYEKQGLGDCSCEDCNANWIEAISDDKSMILIRW